MILSFSYFLTLVNKGCLKQSSNDILKKGLKTRVLYKKSNASSGAPGYFLLRSYFYLGGYDSRYSKALWSVTKLLSVSFGVPITSKIIFI